MAMRTRYKNADAWGEKFGARLGIKRMGRSAFTVKIQRFALPYRLMKRKGGRRRGQQHRKLSKYFTIEPAKVLVPCPDFPPTWHDVGQLVEPRQMRRRIRDHADQAYWIYTGTWTESVPHKW